MTYSLVAIFFFSGDVYVERTGLSLQACAGRAAMARQEAEVLMPRIGEVEYRCEPERSLARTVTETHAIEVAE